MDSLWFKKLHLTFAEDSKTQGMLLKRLLVKDLGIPEENIIWVKSCAELVKSLSQKKADLLLLDLWLGDSEGSSTVGQAIAAAPDTPIVVLTAHDDDSLAIAALRQGAQDYLRKSDLNADRLRKTMRYAFERKLMELDLKKKNKELEELNSQKNQFLGMCAHDLRNPIGVVFGYAELLEELLSENLTDEHRELFATIQRTSSFMLNMLDELLDITSIEAGQLHLDFQKLDVDAFVKQNLELNKLMAKQKNISLNFDSTLSDVKVEIDEGKFRQVLNNLITNAVKYSEPETKVTVGLRESNAEEIILTVADQGQGIPEAEHDKVFKSFGTTSAKPTAGEKSTGLGLLITKRVVEGHGGKIWFESEKNKGTTFFVSVPRFQKTDEISV